MVTFRKSAACTWMCPVWLPHLNPAVGGAQLLHKLRPLVNHLDHVLVFHQREGDVRPGMETHDLTGGAEGLKRFPNGVRVCLRVCVGGGECVSQYVLSEPGNLDLLLGLRSLTDAVKTSVLASRPAPRAQLSHRTDSSHSVPAMGRELHGTVWTSGAGWVGPAVAMTTTATDVTDFCSVSSYQTPRAALDWNNGC